MRSIKMAVILSIIPSIMGLELNAQSDTTKHLDAKEAPYNYVTSWYTGSGAKMELALHSELAKRRVISDTNVASVSYDWMIEATAGCVGCIENAKEGRIDIIILDKTDSIASAKVLSNDFFDYLHLVKFNGYWKVFNVVWDYYGCASGDSAKLVTVLEKYLKYWHAGADEQMAELIHPKYSGGMALSHREAHRTDKTQLLSFISKNTARNSANDINFTILDVYLNTASVKIIGNDFVEYLHLSYQNDKWYIINALRNFNFTR